jgi:hypothetical protein
MLTTPVHRQHRGPLIRARDRDPVHLGADEGEPQLRTAPLGHQHPAPGRAGYPAREPPGGSRHPGARLLLGRGSSEHPRIRRDRAPLESIIDPAPGGSTTASYPAPATNGRFGSSTATATWPARQSTPAPPSPQQLILAGITRPPGTARRSRFAPVTPLTGVANVAMTGAVSVNGAARSTDPASADAGGQPARSTVQTTPTSNAPHRFHRPKLSMLRTKPTHGTAPRTLSPRPLDPG